jgi:hypothetical protein
MSARVTVEPAEGRGVSGRRRTAIAFCPGGSWACAGKAHNRARRRKRRRFTERL